MLTLVFGRQSTPYAKTRPFGPPASFSPHDFVSAAQWSTTTINACVASELICNSNCSSFAKNIPMGRATCSNLCDNIKTYFSSVA